MEITGISVYSVVSAVLFFNIALFVIKSLRRNTKFLIKYSTDFLVVLLIVSLLRIVSPLDMESAFVIRSDTILPFVQRTVGKPFIYNISLYTIAISIWVFGTIIILYKEISCSILEVSKIRNLRKVQNTRIEQVVKECLGDKVVLVISPDIDVPIVTGLRRAYIYMPVLELTDEEIKLVLMHEFQHIKGKDVFIKIFYFVLKAVFWWNPIVHIYQQEVDNLLELRCDAEVSKNMTKDEQIVYLDTILKIIKQSKTKSNNYTKCFSFVGYNTMDLTQQRFEVILNRLLLGKNKSLTGIILILAIFISSYFVVIQPVYYPPFRDIIGNIDIEKDNAYIEIDKNGAYKLYVNNEFYGTVKQEEVESEPLNSLIVKRRYDKNE